MTLTSQPLAPAALPVSELIAGFWRLKHWGWTSQQLLTFIHQLLELGISTVDHAMVYGSEQPFGRALALQPSLRQQLQIVTKFGIRPMGFGVLGAQAVNHYDNSAAAMMQSVESSLTHLGTDYLDVLLVHRPDFLMEVDELAEGFARLRAQGKVRYFGVSNFSKDQFELLHSAWPEGLVTNQIEFSPYTMGALQSGVFEQCQLHGIRPMLWSCLGAGRLLQPEDEKGHRIIAALEQVKTELDCDAVEQVVYAWVRRLPCHPIALLGTSDIERVRIAVAAVELELNREQWYRVWEASEGTSVP